MKEFFILHTEKLALGLCAVLMAWFLYSAFSQSGYAKTPQDFRDIIARAQSNVNNSEPQQADLKPPDLQAEKAKITKPIDPTLFALPMEFHRTYELGFLFRSRPEILTPKSVYISSNRGLVPVIDDKPKASLKEFSRLLKIPYPAELIWFEGNDEMDEVLGIVETKRSEPNRPEPARPGRRRRGGEARPEEPAPAAKPEGNNNNASTRVEAIRWVEVVAAFPHADQLREYIRALKEGVEQVGLRYAATEVERRELTATLEWSPWRRIAWDKSFNLFELGKEQEDPFKILPEGVVVAGLPMRAPQRAMIGSGDAGKPVQVTPNLEPNEFVNTPEPEWKPEELDPRAEDPNAGAPAGNVGKGKMDNYNDSETAMMRVLDFTVEPNRRYQYRVRAVVYNPNYKRAEVVDSADATEPLLFGSWSNPSEEVYVSSDADWFVGETRSTQDDLVQLILYHWSPKMGLWVPLTANQRLGEIAGAGNLPIAQIGTYDPASNKMVPVDEPAGKNFDSSMLIVEITPGRVRPSIDGLGGIADIKPPREVVSVNAFGDLIRRTELADRSSDILSERNNNHADAIRSGGGNPDQPGRNPEPPASDNESNDGFKNPLGEN